MKKTIVTLACALIAPLAFAQTSSKGTRQGPTTAESITVTGTIITTTTEEGAAASYQPVKRSSFARTARIIQTVMFWTGPVAL